MVSVVVVHHRHLFLDTVVVVELIFRNDIIGFWMKR